MNLCICQYCGEERKNINSLRQHEVRCKCNPNKINCNGQHQTRKNSIKGYKWINNGKENKFIHPDKLNEFINNGWSLGLTKDFGNKVSKSLIGKSLGRAATPEKENLRRQKISESMKGNKNWMLNKTRGNGKKGWYHGIFCDSSWELAFVVYCIEHNLNIKRSDKRLEYNWNNETHIYIPDFETDSDIIEIKGRKTKQSEEKHKQFPYIKVIDKDLIIPYLQYVKNKYGEEFWKELYEK